MVDCKNGMVPFSEIVLETIVNIQREGGFVPLCGEKALDGVLIAYLNDKGWIEFRDTRTGSKNICLSGKGFEMYNYLAEYVRKQINL